MQTTCECSLWVGCDCCTTMGSAHTSQTSAPCSHTHRLPLGASQTPLSWEALEQEMEMVKTIVVMRMEMGMIGTVTEMETTGWLMEIVMRMEMETMGATETIMEIENTMRVEMESMGVENVMAMEMSPWG